MRNRIEILLSLLLVACGSDSSVIDQGPASDGDEQLTAFPQPTEPTQPAESPEVILDPGPPVESGLIVHEWGTFTSIQGSDGATLGGVHHTEEYLPRFVHARDPDAIEYGKRMESLPEEVTQKLETPVLYFYSDQPLDVSVEVTFPEGIISEWYPDAEAFSPAIGNLTAIADGVMRWAGHVAPGTVELEPVTPQDIWAPSRLVDATPITIDHESEMFIFYRGLGRFDLPVRVLADTDDVLTVVNDSAEDIPHLFLLHLHEGGGMVSDLGDLAAGDSLITSPAPKESDIEDYVQSARALLIGGLVETGLYHDEAVAMVDTWSTSYFRTPGLRLLYVVPREWTDALLPTVVEPEPDELVRTLVGRIEILTPEAEAEIVHAVTSQFAAGGGLPPGYSDDRFAEAKLRRALSLIPDEAVLRFCEGLVASLCPLP